MALPKAKTTLTQKQKQVVARYLVDSYLRSPGNSLSRAQLVKIVKRQLGVTIK